MKHKAKRFAVGQCLFIIAILAYVISSNSCANQGVGPGGGPRDSIPPVVINSTPRPFQKNYEGEEIQLTFDEYVAADNLASQLIVSPPLAEKPTIKVKGKNISIKFNEDLMSDRTYSIDFEDGIEDYNEGNVLKGLRMLFSTCNYIDTLRISGYLLDAFTLVPVENAMATLYSANEDSSFTSLKPDFIAKADDNGFFMFDNLPEGNFKLYGLVDDDNNLYYSQGTELIAFSDTLITPHAQYIHKMDTIINEGDTAISTGYTKYYPDSVYALLFQQNIYNQYMVSFKREAEDRLFMTFNEPLTDSFRYSLTGIDAGKNWDYVEYGQDRDSINIWITDTLVSKIDSLYLKVAFTTTDSAGTFITQTDTLKMIYASPKNKMKSKKQKKEPEPKPEPGKRPQLYNFTTNLSSDNFDLDKPILITAPLPVEPLKKSDIKFEMLVNDSTTEQVNFDFHPLEKSKRTFVIDYQPQEGTSYQLSIDSASTYSLLKGLLNDGLELVFKTQKANYYGTAIMEINGLEDAGIVELLKNSEKEEVVKTLKIGAGTRQAVFDFLKPGKYEVKLIADANNNGKWDTGDIEKNIQPEKVYYFPKVINVKSNWELKENWDLASKMNGPKNLTDPDKKEEENKTHRNP